MNFDRPMNVVTPTVDGDVLTALALADAWFTTGRIHQTIGRHSEDGIRRVLRRLAGQGIIETLSGGPAVLYRLNRRHLAAPPVIQLGKPAVGACPPAIGGSDEMDGATSLRSTVRIGGLGQC